ncbi:hypothetical protein OJF2_38230 [Aquisphaera giovannonii]|uniref:Antitoxin SocA-like Panacea domain-containing protein n=1 Tax=Aquisphaera giovannonii TaxID=406548 RepID=A0A5B9W537_9BACT|nr:hypothetical protein [Aquisphaera giovannonii]QEH35275.1 hypothetical protein OJF2_38230 [Aquisphaera giovannonii]
MNRYQLAKVVNWAGTLETRKRMQKVIYLLQVAGCPLGASYTLHHYGPYSQDVARLTDEMVQAGLLTERTTSNGVGQQYSYSLSDAASRNLTELESSASRGPSSGLDAILSEKRWLLEQDLKDLEYASTIVFFRQQGHDWPSAVEKMCRFKGLAKGSQVVERADALARRVVA